MFNIVIEGISNITNIFNTDDLKKQFIRFFKNSIHIKSNFCITRNNTSMINDSRSDKQNTKLENYLLDTLKLRGIINNFNLIIYIYQHSSSDKCKFNKELEYTYFNTTSGRYKCVGCKAFYVKIEKNMKEKNIIL